MNEGKPEQNSKEEKDRTEPKILLFEKYADWGITITAVITIAYWLFGYRGKLFEQKTIIEIATITPLSLLITTFGFEIAGGLLVSLLSRSIERYKEAMKPFIVIKQLRRENKEMAAGFKSQTKTDQATIARLERELKKADIDIDSNEE